MSMLHVVHAAGARVPRRQVGRDHSGVPQLGVPHDKGGAAVHASPAVGPHHQYRCTPLLATTAFVKVCLEPCHGLLYPTGVTSTWPLSTDPTSSCAVTMSQHCSHGSSLSVSISR